jgi:hypothetical protein
MVDAAQCRGCIHTEELKMATKSKAKIVKKSKIANGAARPGVVQAIVTIMSRETGASANEILAALVRKFPARDPEKMRNTIQTQTSRHVTKGDRDEKRGLVYFRRGRSPRVSSRASQ